MCAEKFRWKIYTEKSVINLIGEIIHRSIFQGQAESDKQ